MKKAIAAALLSLVLVFCAACADNSRKNVYISDKVLVNFNLGDVERPNGKFEYVDGGKLFLTITKENFTKFNAEAFTHLSANYPKTLGYCGKELTSLFGACPTYELFLSKNISDFCAETEEKTSYNYVYSIDDDFYNVEAETSGDFNKKLLNDRAAYITYYNETQTYTFDEQSRYDNFEYNCMIILTDNFSSYQLVE